MSSAARSDGLRRWRRAGVALVPARRAGATPSGPELTGPPESRRRRHQPDALRYPTLVTLVFDHLTQNSRTLARRAALQFVARGDAGEPMGCGVRPRPAAPARADVHTGSGRAASAIERATAAGAAEGHDRLAKGATNQEQAQRSADAAGAAVTAAASAGTAANMGAAVSEAQVAEVIARMERMVEAADVQQRGQSTLFPLMALMKAQGTLAGRKALLFFSEGLPIPPSLEEAYRSPISEANRANVSVYAVDARGLDTSRSLDQSRQMLDRSGRNSQSQQAYGASSRPVTMDDVMNSETAEGALRADTQNVPEGARRRNGRNAHREYERSRAGPRGPGHGRSRQLLRDRLRAARRRRPTDIFDRSR